MCYLCTSQLSLMAARTTTWQHLNWSQPLFQSKAACIAVSICHGSLCCCVSERKTTCRWVVGWTGVGETVTGVYNTMEQLSSDSQPVAVSASWGSRVQAVDAVMAVVYRLWHLIYSKIVKLRKSVTFFTYILDIFLLNGGILPNSQWQTRNCFPHRLEGGSRLFFFSPVPSGRHHQPQHLLVLTCAPHGHVRAHLFVFFFFLF